MEDIQENSAVSTPQKVKLVMVNDNAKEIRKRHLAHSNYLITINPNKRYESTDSAEFQEDLIKFKNVIDDILKPREDSEGFVNYITFTQKSPVGSCFNKVCFESAEIQIGFECGERGFLHCHIGAIFRHRVLMKLDILKMREDLGVRLSEQLGIFPGAFHLNFSLDTKANRNLKTLMEYVTKNQKMKTYSPEGQLRDVELE
jgi:hypothetical protein